MTGMEVSYLAAVGAGLLSFLSPCVLPLVIPYLAFLGGVTLREADPEASSAATLRRVLPASFTFVLGFSTVFIAMGATASALSGLITRYIHVLAPVAGLVIIVLGLHFLGVFRILALFREVRFQVESRPGPGRRRASSRRRRPGRSRRRRAVRPAGIRCGSGPRGTASGSGTPPGSAGRAR